MTAGACAVAMSLAPSVGTVLVLAWYCQAKRCLVHFFLARLILPDWGSAHNRKAGDDVLQIRPGAEHGRRVWEVAYNRPPTTAEAIRRIQDQRRGPGPVDVDCAAACVEALRDLGVPE